MTEPTPEAYEAAGVVSAPLISASEPHNPQAVARVTMRAYETARAAYDRTVISHGAIGHRAGHHGAILAAVDAVWDLAEATVRAKVAAEIRAEMDKIAVRAEVAARVKAGTADEHPLLVGIEFAARIAEGNGDETKTSSAGPSGG